MTEQSLAFLIVEDEALLAMDIAGVIEETGHHVIGEAASLSEVVALPERPVPDCAFVDVQLLHGSSGVDAACLLRELHEDLRILFLTANPGHVPPGFAGAVGILEKPFTHTGLAAAIRYLGHLVAGTPSDPPSVIRPIRVREEL